MALQRRLANALATLALTKRGVHNDRAGRQDLALSEQELMDVLRYFESAPEAQEVRRAARVSVRRHVTIVTDLQSDAGTKEVVLQDISRGGVRITHHDAFARDARFLLLLPGRGGRPVEVPCTVRHCQMLKQHLFRIGAEFDPAEKGSGQAIQTDAAAGTGERSAPR